MLEAWFVRRGEEQWGPLTAAQYEDLARQGAILSDDWVWFDNWTTWRRFGETHHASNRKPPPIPPTDKIEVELNDALARLNLTDAIAHIAKQYVEDLHLPSPAKAQFSELLADFLQPIERLRALELNESGLRAAVQRSAELIENLWHATRRTDSAQYDEVAESDRQTRIWSHRDLARAFQVGPSNYNACPMWRESVSELAIDYLSQDLRSAKFEVLLVDALVAMEVYGFGEELKKSPSRYTKTFTLDVLARGVSDQELYDAANGNLDDLTWLWLKRNAKWAIIRTMFVYGLPLAAACVGVAYQMEALAVAGTALLSILIGLGLVSRVWRKLKSLIQTAEKTPVEKAFELHHKMVQAYDELKGGAAASPNRVREVLARVADEGAVWDPGVFSILDAAIARSPGRWS